MIELFAIYPTAPDLRHAPTMVKVSNALSAVIVFRDRANADLYIKNNLSSADFEVKELTLFEFDKARQEEKSYLGVDIVLRIFD